MAFEDRTIVDVVQASLRCPECRAGLMPTGAGGWGCTQNPEHNFAEENGIVRFPSPPAGKYDHDYSTRYAFAWSYGGETLHSGWNESLYRTISSLVAEVLCDDWSVPRLIVDGGCGVGRVSADCGRLGSKASVVLGFDASIDMLRLAQTIVRADEDVHAEVSGGIGLLNIAGRARQNVRFFQGDVLSLPLEDAAADVALSINVIDRITSVPDAPARVVEECKRILKPGGVLILTDPLNWQTSDLWHTYDTGKKVVEMIESRGFAVDTWFDELLYRERLDRRGASEEWPTLVVRATAER